MSTEEEDIRGFRQWNPSMQEDLLILRFVPVTFRGFWSIHGDNEILNCTVAYSFDVDLGLESFLHNDDW